MRGTASGYARSAIIWVDGRTEHRSRAGPAESDADSGTYADADADSESDAEGDSDLIRCRFILIQNQTPIPIPNPMQIRTQNLVRHRVRHLILHRRRRLHPCQIQHLHLLLMFHALERSLLTIRQLRPVVATVSRHDPSLAKQLRTAASSIVLNLSEANGRTGRDRTHLFRIALGSTKESQPAVSLAVAWGYPQEVK